MSLQLKNGKNPFEERKFSISFSPQTFNYNDYKTAWYRAFFIMPNIHSWFFNFHEQCSNTFPVWFYHWWTMFGGLTMIFPVEAHEGWTHWNQTATNIELYMRDVQFFKQFNVAWIFSWEYRLQHFLPHPYPLSLVRIYKVKWWSEFKTRLCSKENVDHFCKTGKRKFTLHNLHLFEKAKAPVTTLKKDVKSKVPRRQQKPRRKDCHKKNVISWNIWKMIQAWNKLFYKKFWTKRTTQMMKQSALQHHRRHQNLTIIRILRIPMICNWQRTARACLLAKCKVQNKLWPCKGQMALGKSKGYFPLTCFLFCRYKPHFGKLLMTNAFYRSIRNDQKKTKRPAFSIAPFPSYYVIHDLLCMQSQIRRQKEWRQRTVPLQFLHSAKADSFLSQRTWAVQTYHIPLTKNRSALIAFSSI